MAIDTPTKMDRDQAAEVIRQIGFRNMMAISGLRWHLSEQGTVLLPVGEGYSVEVVLTVFDEYVVRRVLARRQKGITVLLPKGERTRVDCFELGQVAYQASSFASYDENEWPYL